MQNEENYRSVLVLGNGAFCLNVGHEIESLSCPVTVALSSDLDPQRLGAGSLDAELWASARMLDFSGRPGRFRAVFDVEGEVKEGLFGCVVVALECLWKSSLDKWADADTEGIVALSRFSEPSTSPAGQIRAGDKVVFISGFKHSSWPSTQEQIVTEAMALRADRGAEVYVLTEHFKVAAEGMERLFRNAREAGVIFVKFSNSSPDLVSGGDGLIVRYLDEAWGKAVQLRPRLVVIEDEACPPREAPLISRMLEINASGTGFLQGDFIFNLPIFTNRTGIFVVGSGKGPMSKEQARAEARSVTLEIAKLFSCFDQSPKKPFARLDERRCGQCLTCFRICPHRAISIYYEKSKPQISPIACRGCGLCVAACPMKAIDLDGYERDDVMGQLDREVDRMLAETSDDQPKVLALACQNSAYDAYMLAKEQGSSVMRGLSVFKIPCGGRVDLEQIVRPLHAGVDGVMVLACHHDSCKSVYGSITCEQRVRILQGMLEQVGVDKAKVSFATIAPGAGAEFVALLNDFRDRLAAMNSANGLQDRSVESEK